MTVPPAGDSPFLAAGPPPDYTQSGENMSGIYIADVVIGFFLVLVLFLHYVANRKCRATGCWLAWSVLAAAGPFLNHEIAFLPAGARPVFAFAADAFGGGAYLFLYAGLRQFFGKRRFSPFSLVLCAASVLVSLFGAFRYFSTGSRLPAVTACVFGATSLYAASAAQLLAARIQSASRVSVVFNAIVCASLAVWYAIRASLALGLIPVPGAAGYFLLVDALVMMPQASAFLCAFGFLVMCDQRSAAEQVEAREHLKLIFKTHPDAVWIIRLADGVILDVNNRFLDLTGQSRGDVIGKTSFQIGLWSDDAVRARVFDLMKRGGEKIENTELEYRTKDGKVRNGIFSSRRLLHRGEVHVIGVIHDVTERRQLEEVLQHQAETDDLTGLPNRRHFMALAAAEIKRASRLGHQLSLAMIDIDLFKNINDTWGHAAGDKALVAFVEVCRAHVREIDVFARVGGDEFVVMFPETGMTIALEIMTRVCQLQYARAFVVRGVASHISISVGISTLAGERDTLDELLSRADRAMYRSKDRGRNRVTLQDES